MRRQIIRSPRFSLDLLDIYIYLGTRNLDAVERLRLAVENALDRLVLQPKMGQQYRTSSPDLPELRHWPITGFTNYIIYYLPLPNGIEALRILHGMRDVSSLLDEST